jgi:hypothetical protein
MSRNSRMQAGGAFSRPVGTLRRCLHHSPRDRASKPYDRYLHPAEPTRCAKIPARFRASTPRHSWASPIRKVGQVHRRAHVAPNTLRGFNARVCSYCALRSDAPSRGPQRRSSPSGAFSTSRREFRIAEPRSGPSPVPTPPPGSETRRVCPHDEVAARRCVQARALRPPPFGARGGAVKFSTRMRNRRAGAVCYLPLRNLRVLRSKLHRVISYPPYRPLENRVCTCGPLHCETARVGDCGRGPPLGSKPGATGNLHPRCSQPVARKH